MTKQLFNPEARPPRPPKKDPGWQYARLLERHEKLEAELFRAQNRWAKSRAALKRLAKKLDAISAVEMNKQLDEDNVVAFNDIIAEVDREKEFYRECGGEE